MNKLAIIAAALALLTAPGAANAAACRNAQGHFTKCPPPAAARPHAAATHAVGAAHKAPCRDAKGRFKKC
jgi:hypothetical protein